MSAIDPGEGSSLPMASLGGDQNEMGRGKGGRKRSIDDESSLVAKKNRKLSDEGFNANINSKLPPELLSVIFSFLPYSDLKKALLVCRWKQMQAKFICIQYLYFYSVLQCYSVENWHMPAI